MTMPKLQCPHCHNQIVIRLARPRPRGPAHVNADASRRVLIVQQKVARHFGVTLDDILVDQRNDGLVLPRQVACYIAREITRVSWPVLGKLFDRDQATISASHKRITQMMAKDEGFRTLVTDLAESVRATASPGARTREEPPEPAAPAAAE